MDTEDRYTRITLRIPKDLHARLSQSADDTSKSMNAEIISRLERSVEGDELGLSRDMMDTLGLQALLTLTAFSDLDTSNMTDAQVMARQGLLQVSERIASSMQLNKSGDKAFSTAASVKSSPKQVDKVESRAQQLTGRRPIKRRDS